MPHLNNWIIRDGDGDPYLAPELRTPRLHGEVFGDSRFKEGQIVTTSTIIGRRGDLVITKNYTAYELGKALAEYEAQFPNAKARLLASLPEVGARLVRQAAFDAPYGAAEKK